MLLLSTNREANDQEKGRCVAQGTLPTIIHSSRAKYQSTYVATKQPTVTTGLPGEAEHDFTTIYTLMTETER
jgi:hypothetical protein